jgi:acyl carrier protein
VKSPFSRSRRQDAIESVFEGRPVLSDDDFYEQYFASEGITRDVAMGVRRAFIEHIPLDMRRLVPEDNFGRELNFVWSYDSMADVELICDIEKRFGISISDAEARSALTMGDLIRLVHRKLDRGGHQNGHHTS